MRGELEDKKKKKKMSGGNLSRKCRNEWIPERMHKMSGEFEDKTQRMSTLY